MKREWILPSIVVSFFLAGAIRAETFDLATFAPPAGWQMQNKGSAMYLASVDEARNTYCLIFIYPSQASTGSLSQDFAREWQNFQQRGFSVDAVPPAAERRSSAGLRYLEGSAVARQDTTPLFARLLVFPAGARVQSVLLLGPNREAFLAYSSQVDRFLGSLRFASPGAGGESRVDIPPVVPQAPTPDTGGFSGGGIAGVWMGFTTGIGSYEPSPRWYTFYDDGTVFTDLPGDGLLGFDRRASQAGGNQANYWGTYAVSGGAGAIRRPGVNVPIRIKVLSANQIQLDNDTFYHCVRMDGLLLDGSWTSFANPRDPDLARLPPGRKPVITLARDGRFADEGVFAAFLHSSYSDDDPRDRAGAGTYEIRNYTLVLHYSDGRVKQVAFTALLGADPARSSDILFLRRSRFNRIP